MTTHTDQKKLGPGVVVTGASSEIARGRAAAFLASAPASALTGAILNASCGGLPGRGAELRRGRAS
ncbi:MAG: hypothetical protein HY302_12050 [Opitutae bacterium]|nr:hypothetical protein [Opitutae bacterium]